MYAKLYKTLSSLLIFDCSFPDWIEWYLLFEKYFRRPDDITCGYALLSVFDNYQSSTLLSFVG